VSSSNRPHYQLMKKESNFQWYECIPVSPPQQRPPVKLHLSFADRSFVENREKILDCIDRICPGLIRKFKFIKKGKAEEEKTLEYKQTFAIDYFFRQLEAKEFAKAQRAILFITDENNKSQMQNALSNARKSRSLSEKQNDLKIKMKNNIAQIDRYIGHLQFTLYPFKKTLTTEKLSLACCLLDRSFKQAGLAPSAYIPSSDSPLTAFVSMRQSRELPDDKYVRVSELDEETAKKLVSEVDNSPLYKNSLVEIKKCNAILAIIDDELEHARLATAVLTSTTLHSESKSLQLEDALNHAMQHLSEINSMKEFLEFKLPNSASIQETLMKTSPHNVAWQKVESILVQGTTENTFKREL
jgi:hypothetical protein